MTSEEKDTRVNVLECPNCGGNIDITQVKDELINCSYCGTALRIPRPSSQSPVEREDVSPAKRLSPEEFQRAWDTVPEWIKTQKVYSREEVLRGRALSWVWGALILSIILVIGIVIAVGALDLTSIFPESYAVLSSPLPIPEMNSAGLILRTYGETDHNYLGLLDLETQKLRWRVEIFSENLYSSILVVYNDLIFLNDRSDLYAFQIMDGKLAWKQSLTNEISSGCGQCVRGIGSQIVVLTKDGVLQAFQVSDGRAAWNVHLNTSPNQLLLVKGAPAVIDRDENKNDALWVYDPITGKLKSKFQPVCPAQGGKQHPGDFMVNRDGSAVFALYTYLSSAAGCVQRYDATNFNLVWERVIKQGETLSSGWRYNRGEILETTQGLLLYEDRDRRGIGTLDLQKGELRLLSKEPRYQDYKPVGQQGQVVIVSVAPDYDSNEHEIWGIDLASGQRKWSFALSKDPECWQVKQIDSGEVAVIQCLNTEKQTVLDLLDPITGHSSGRRQITSSANNFLKDVWIGQTAYLVLDSHLYVVDLKAGTVRLNW